MLVPGGGLSPDGRTWLEPPRRKTRYLVPVRALGALFRGRFLALARRALPELVVPERAAGRSWIVYAKPAVRGADMILEYLGRYVHRTAMSDKAVVDCDEQTVTFSYRDSRDHRHKRMTLPAHEFLRRFLQHAPPKGLHRVRAFGLLHPEHRVTLRRLQALLSRHAHPAPPPAPPPRLRCPRCRTGTIVPRRRLSARACFAYAERDRHRLPFVTRSGRGPPLGDEHA
jgi:hypothetical protein